MNAISIIEAAPAVSQTDWIARGKALAEQRREVDWRLADWMSEGRDAGYITQAGFDFLSGELGLAPKRLKDALKAATVFPPSQRDTSLTIEHHAVVAALPKDEAMSLLSRAAKERAQVQDLKEAVTQWRYSHGHLFEDDDKDTTLCTLIVRAWNRATPEARQSFMELAANVGTGIIDEDEVNDTDA